MRASLMRPQDLVRMHNGQRAETRMPKQEVAVVVMSMEKVRLFEVIA